MILFIIQLCRSIKFKLRGNITAPILYTSERGSIMLDDISNSSPSSSISAASISERSSVLSSSNKSSVLPLMMEVPLTGILFGQAKYLFGRRISIAAAHGVDTTAEHG